MKYYVDIEGRTYEIDIGKPEGICRGKVALLLDGRPLDDNLIPPQADGKTHQVKATMHP